MSRRTCIDLSGKEGGYHDRCSRLCKYSNTTAGMASSTGLTAADQTISGMSIGSSHIKATS
eukprot:51246-Eustigmatos_ZCMA.PRE.1